MSSALVVGWAVEVVIVGSVLVGLTRLGRDRILLWVTVASFLLRLLVGLSMYTISVLGMSILPELHHPHRGFWIIAPDADLYDGEARSAAGALLGRPVDRTVNQAFSWALGLIYAIFGDSPPQGLLFNAFAASACVPLGYWIASLSRMGRRESLAVAGLVAFWPSSFVWSGQLLKDPLQWLGLFAMVVGAAQLLSTDDQSGPAKLRTMTASVTFVVTGAFSTAWLRGNVTPAWVLAVVLGLGMLVAMNRIERHPWPLFRAGVLMAAVLLGSIPAHGQVVLATGIARSAVEESIRAVAALVPSITHPTAPTPSPPAVRLPPAVRPPEPCPPAIPLLGTRQGSLHEGGSSLVDLSVQFKSCWDVLAYVPRAAYLTFLAPAPAERAESGYSLGLLRRLSQLDVILLWLLLPGLLAGLVHTFIRPTGVLIIVAIFILVLGVVLGLVMANYGTLFRLRLQVILPASVLAVKGWTLLLTKCPSRLQYGRTPSRSVGPLP